MQSNVKASVAAAIEDGTGRLLIATRTVENQPCLPGGKVDYGETCENALIREVREETGLEVKVGKLLGYSNDIWETSHYVTLYFSCTIIGGKLEEPEPHKLHSFRWVNKFNLPKMYANAETIVGKK